VIKFRNFFYAKGLVVMSGRIQSESRIRFAEFDLDLRTGEIWTQDRKFVLQEKPFRILSTLVQRPGELITREELKTRLWSSNTFVDFDHSLNKAVNRLRDALGDSAEHPRFIETVSSRGYRFVAAIEPVEAAFLSKGENRDSDHSESIGATLSIRRWDYRRLAVIALIAAAIVLTAFVLRSRIAPHSPRIEGLARPNTIAIIPFQNSDSDPDTDFLRFALPDEVANELSYGRTLSIRPSAASSKFVGPDIDLQKIGRAMHVANIVTGHYLKEGHQLFVTLEAVDVEENRVIWRGSLTAASPNMIAIREQISTRIREGLLPVLGLSVPTDSGTHPKNEWAYDLYLRSVAVPHDVGPNKGAIALLERSVGMDPSFAPAWQALGLRYYLDLTFANGGEEMLQRARAAFERALALDQGMTLAASQLVLMRLESGKPDNAYNEARMLVKSQPNSSETHFLLGFVLRYAGLIVESAHECDTATSLDPGNYLLRSCAWTFQELGKTDRARDYVRLDAGSEWSAYASAPLLMREGKLAEAQTLVENMSPNHRYHRDLLKACLGRRSEVELGKLAREAESQLGKAVDPEPLYYQAAILAFCGQEEHAVRLLRGAIEGNYCANGALQSDPLLEKLRGTEQFRGLVAAANQCQQRFLAP
jgi:DNA-binding winged helix-turn-helix (wHTH) protein/TolB-like protein/Tfp pilus assembly protein PilF